jgi:hypothetical protein
MCHLKSCESSDENAKNKCHVSALRKYFKWHVSYDSSISPLEIITRNCLRDFGTLEFLLFRLFGTPEARSFEATIKDLVLKFDHLLYFVDHKNCFIK